jgi:hypothetical protein
MDQGQRIDMVGLDRVGELRPETVRDQVGENVQVAGVERPVLEPCQRHDAQRVVTSAMGASG